MRTPAVDDVFRALWAAREQSRGWIARRSVWGWGRRLAKAVYDDLPAHPDYNPEEDNRVLWAREVLQAARRSEPVTRACGELEAAADFLLGLVPEPCGKDRAAND